MILSSEQQNDLNKIIRGSLRKLYLNDIELIKIGGMEQAIAFRFGLYLVKESNQFDWLKDLNVDMEYNKNGNDQKKTFRRQYGTRPDLIIHKRGTNETNVLIVEIKGWWNNEPREMDIIKLEDFTSQYGDYKYGYGVILELNPEEPEINYFSDYAVDVSLL